MFFATMLALDDLSPFQAPHKLGIAAFYAMCYKNWAFEHGWNMTKNQILTLALVISTLACSGDGRRTLAGSQCLPNAKPVDLNFDETKPKNKAIKKAAITDALPDGEYTYLGATYFYEDKSGFRIQVNDVKPEGATEFVAVRGCVLDFQNAKIGMADAARGISHMTIKNGETSFIEVKYIGFEMTTTGLVAIGKVDANSKPTTPAGAYENVSEKFVLAHPKDVYEIRSSDVDMNFNGASMDSKSKSYLSVRFKRTDLKP